MLLFKTKFPYRAIIIACILFFLSFIFAMNYLFQNGKVTPSQLLIVYFILVIILYFLFLWKITVIRFLSQCIQIKKTFRFLNNLKEIDYLAVQKVIFKHQDIGGALLIFYLISGDRIRVRYPAVGGIKELRKMSNILRNRDIPVIIHRHGSEKSSE